MAVYLAEYRRSGDPRRAVQAAAEFHADYNQCAVVLLVGVLAFVGIVSGLQLILPGSVQ